ncbi:MAG: hypothetical protein AAF741_01060 [Bacteroidota bacterium]
MSIWERIFGPTLSPVEDSKLGYRFGRYSDAYKDQNNYTFWKQSLAQMESGHFLESVKAFLAYLRDDDEDNVRWEEREGQIYFEFYQGSKRISGSASEEGIKAEAKIARLGVANSELLQRLTSLNYELRYSRYALDDSRCLCIIFDSKSDDASPHKLYYAFKEIALQADKQDDLLIDEFRQLVQVEQGHLKQINLEAKRIKEAFLRKNIQNLLDYLGTGHLNPEEHPGGLAYLLLDVVFRLDYLIRPEGPTMEALERMQRMYFAGERDQPITHRNMRLIGELQELLRRAPDEFGKELYLGKYTFAITSPAKHDRFRQIIDGELGKLDWYQENDYPVVAAAVPSYIVSYSLFNFALPEPLRDFLHLYMRIREDAYFKQLGYAQEYLTRNNKPIKKSIRASIAELVQRHKSNYPYLRPLTSILEYGNLTEFGKSYLKMLYELDLGTK